MRPRPPSRTSSRCSTHPALYVHLRRTAFDRRHATKEVVAKIDRKLLVVALKGTSDQLKDHVLQCMSSAAARCCARIGSGWTSQGPRCRSGAATNPRRGAATGVPRCSQFEGRREQSECRLNFQWRSVDGTTRALAHGCLSGADRVSRRSKAEQQAVSRLDQARRDAFAEGLAAGRQQAGRAGSPAIEGLAQALANSPG